MDGIHKIYIYIYLKISGALMIAKAIYFGMIGIDKDESNFLFC